MPKKKPAMPRKRNIRFRLNCPDSEPSNGEGGDQQTGNAQCSHSAQMNAETPNPPAANDGVPSHTSVVPPTNMPAPSQTNRSQGNSNDSNAEGLEEIQPINSAVNVNRVDSNGQRKRTRGRSTLNEIWNVPPEDRILVVANARGQPIGDEAQLLSGLLGKLARSNQKCPIHYETWHQMPLEAKKANLDFVETRFCLQFPDAHSYVLKSLGKKWRDYKYEIKQECFVRTDGIEVTLKKRPDRVLEWQYEKLAAHWYSQQGEKKEIIGIKSRSQQKFTHTSGSKSFARLQNEMVLDGKDAGRASMYIETHTKKDGSHMNTESQLIVDKLKEKLVPHLNPSAENMEDVNMCDVENNVFKEVLGDERNGRVRGLGLGPTPTSYYGSSSQQYTSSQSKISGEVKRLRDEIARIEAERKEELARVEAERREELARIAAEREEEKANFARINDRLNHIMSVFNRRFPGNDGGDPQSPAQEAPGGSGAQFGNATTNSSVKSHGGKVFHTF